MKNRTISPGILSVYTRDRLSSDPDPVAKAKLSAAGRIDEPERKRQLVGSVGDRQDQFWVVVKDVETSTATAIARDYESGDERLEGGLRVRKQGPRPCSSGFERSSTTALS